MALGTHPGLDPDADAKRFAIQVIATLVNNKKNAARKVLEPAGVPAELIRRFLSELNPTTGERLTKREGAVLILDELARTPGQDLAVIRGLINLAAEWSDFHLAADEFDARAVVMRARAMEGTLADLEAREKAIHKEASRKRHGFAENVRQQCQLLLHQFDDLTSSADPQNRGFLLQDLLNRLFDLYQFPVQRAFQRNQGGEQIDGAFEMDGWHYIVECRWREKLANIRELDGLRGQVTRSGHQTMGLFLSINGWSENVPVLLKQNPEKRIFMMEGLDLRSVLAQHIDLRKLLKAKLSRLNLHDEPYISVSRIVN